MSLILRTQVKEPDMVASTRNATPGAVKMGRFLGSLAGQSRLMTNYRPIKDPISIKKKGGRVSGT